MFISVQIVHNPGQMWLGSGFKLTSSVDCAKYGPQSAQLWLFHCLSCAVWSVMRLNLEIVQSVLTVYSRIYVHSQGFIEGCM